MFFRLYWLENVNAPGRVRVFELDSLDSINDPLTEEQIRNELLHKQTNGENSAGTYVAGASTPGAKGTPPTTHAGSVIKK